MTTTQSFCSGERLYSSFQTFLIQENLYYQTANLLVVFQCTAVVSTAIMDSATYTNGIDGT